MVDMRDKNNKYFLGLDVGIASLGWAVMAESADGSKRWLDDFGVRLFNLPVENKTQTTLAAIRRRHRSMRRNFRRQRFRIKRLKEFLVEKKIVGQQELNDFLKLLREKKSKWTSNKSNFRVDKFSVTNKIIGFDESKYVNFYHLANQSLKKEIRPEFLSYLLLYLARHRGYKNFFSKEGDKEQGRVADTKQRFKNADRFEDYSALYEYLIKRSKTVEQNTNLNQHLKDITGTRNHQKPYLTDITFFSNKSENDFVPFRYFSSHTVLKNLWKDGFQADQLEQLVIFVTKSRPKVLNLQQKILDVKPEFEKKKARDYAEKLIDYSFLEVEQLLKLVNFWNCSEIEVDVDKISSLIESLKSGSKVKDQKLDRLLNFCKEHKSKKYFKFMPLFQADKYNGKNPASIKDFFNLHLISKDKKINKDLIFMVNLSSQTYKLKGLLSNTSISDWEDEKTKWRNQYDFLFKRDFVEKNIRLILKRQSVAHFYPQYEILKQNDLIEKIVSIICHQRTFEEGPSINVGSKSLKSIHRYYGFGEKQLSLTAKRSEISGKKVGFRVSTIGDLYNACEEISKLTAILYRPRESNNAKNQERHETIKSFHQKFLKHYCDPESSFWQVKETKQDEKSDLFLDFRPVKVKEWVEKQYKKNNWKLPKWFKFCQDKEKKYEHINIRPKVYRLLMGLKKKGYISDKEVINSHWYYKISSISPIFKFTKIFFLYKTPHKIVERLKKVIVSFPELQPIIDYLFKDEGIELAEEENKSQDSLVRSFSEKLGSGMCRLTFKEMISIIIDFQNGVPTNISRQTKRENLLSDRNNLKNWKFLGAINDPNLIYNKTVFRSINQLRKVLRALFQKYSTFSAINIETARDLNMGPDKRRQIENQNRKNYASRQRVYEEFYKDRDELHKDRDKGEFLKYWLWTEQNRLCMYCGRKIEGLDQVQVDHIIPQSRFQNNSRSNKVASCWGCNKKKSTTPAFKFVKTCQVDNASKYLARIKKIKDVKKQKFLQLEDFESHWLKDFSSRSLNDDRYISRYFFNYVKLEINNYYKKFQIKLVGDSPYEYQNYHPNINSVNGSVTSQFRSKWFKKSCWGKPGVYKDQLRKISDFHHAVDAMVLASFIDEEDIKIKTDQVVWSRFCQKKSKTDNDKYEKECKEFWNVLLKKYKRKDGDKNYSDYIKNEIIGGINDDSCTHPFLGKAGYKEVETRIPVRLKFEKNDPLKPGIISIEKVLDESTYKNEVIHYSGHTHYPFISYMVNAKTQRGGFGSENIVPKKSKKVLEGKVIKDTNNNRWERDLFWGYYFVKNYESNEINVKFIKNIDAKIYTDVFRKLSKLKQNGGSPTNNQKASSLVSWLNFNDVDLILPLQPLVWNINGKLKNVFISGKTGNRVFLRLNGVCRNHFWINKDGKLEEKTMHVSATDLIKSGLNKCTVSLLGIKNSVKKIKFLNSLNFNN